MEGNNTGIKYAEENTCNKIQINDIVRNFCAETDKKRDQFETKRTFSDLQNQLQLSSFENYQYLQSLNLNKNSDENSNSKIIKYYSFLQYLQMVNNIQSFNLSIFYFYYRF
jgi:hypothetical protein